MNTETKYKAGDWVIYGLNIGQIKEIRDDGCSIFSDSFCETSGFNIANRFRPLTLRNKSIVETFNIYYNKLREIDGEAGFNYPEICRYFETLCLSAIDNTNNKQFFDKGIQFSRDARDYKPVIDGIRLFRRK